MVEIEANDVNFTRKDIIGTNYDSNENKVSYLNKILRGEVSACESYQQVIEKFDDDKNEQDKLHLLNKIKEDHEHHVEKLESFVQNTHDVSEEESGPWGTVVSTLVNMAKLGGSNALVKVLIEGEEHGLKEYKEVLNYNLTPTERTAIETELIPSIESNISILRSISNLS